MPNPFLFFRHRSERDKKRILDAEEWRADRRISRKLHVIKKLVARGQRDVIVPEDVEIPL